MRKMTIRYLQKWKSGLFFELNCGVLDFFFNHHGRHILMKYQKIQRSPIHHLSNRVNPTTRQRLRVRLRPTVPRLGLVCLATWIITLTCKWVELGFTGVIRIFKPFPNVCYKLLFWGYTSTKSNSIDCDIVLRLVIPSSRNRRKGCTYTGLMNNLFIVKQLDLIPTTATLVLFTNQWNPRMETKRSSPWEITS